MSHFTLLADLEALPNGVGQLGQHVLRCVNRLLSVGVLLVVSLVVDRRVPADRRLPFGFWGCLLIAAAVVLQPVVFSPQYALHNETRLGVLGLGALVCCLAYVPKDASWVTPARAWALLGILAIVRTPAAGHAL